MLTHKITPYKEPIWAPTVVQRLPVQPHGGWGRPMSQRKETRFHFDGVCYVMNEFSPKVRYAQWLGSLGLKAGDYVVNKDARRPLLQGNYIRVMGLQEVQFLCQYDIDGRPRALQLVDRAGPKAGWWTSPDDWEKTDPPKPEWCYEIEP